MKKSTKIIIGVLIILILIQFIRPARNNGNAFGRNDFSHEVTVPDSVMKILKHSCFDCHSNKTVYPWYSEINPVGWWLNHHINEGKDELNFSEFASYSPTRKQKKLEKIADEVKEGKMPLESYTWIHKDAILTEQQIAAIVNWANTATKKLKAIAEKTLATIATAQQPWCSPRRKSYDCARVATCRACVPRTR